MLCFVSSIRTGKCACRRRYKSGVRIIQTPVQTYNGTRMSHTEHTHTHTHTHVETLDNINIYIHIHAVEGKDIEYTENIRNMIAPGICLALQIHTHTHTEHTCIHFYIHIEIFHHERRTVQETVCTRT